MMTMLAGRSAWGITGAITVAMASVTLLPSSLGVLAPLITADLGLSTFQLGTLTSCIFVVGAALSIPAGRLVDRLGGLTLLRLLFAAMLISLVAGAAAPSYVWLLGAVSLGGFALAVSNPATNEIVAERIAPSSQGLVIGIKQSGVQLAPVLAGTALLWVSINSSWRGAMLAGLACPLLGVALTLIYVPQRHLNRRRELGHAPLPWRNVGWLAAYAFLMGSATANIATYLPLFAHDRLGLSIATSGLVSASMAIAAVATRIIWGHIGGRLGRLPLLLSMIAFLAFDCLLAMWLGGRFWPGLLWFGAVGTGATAGAWNALGMLAIIRQDDAGGTGAASGFVLLGFYAGWVAAPLVFGLIVDATGSFDLGWSVVASCYAIAALISLARLVLDRRRGRLVGPPTRARLQREDVSGSAYAPLDGA